MSPQNPQRGGPTRIDRLILLLLVPGLLSALLLGAWRFDVESKNKAVELTLDYAEIQSLSVSSGVRIPELLDRFKAVGVTGVAVSEDLLGDLVATGQATYTQRASDAGPFTVIRISSKHLADRAQSALHMRLGSDMLLGDDDLGDGRWVSAESDTFVVRAAPVTLNAMGIGLPPDAVRIVKNSGLDVVARLQNHPTLTRTAVDAAIDDIEHDEITRVIFAGEEVLGFRGLIPYAAERMKSAGLIYGSVEFARQRGDARMCGELDSGFIRVHSISQAEMAGLSPSAAAERFARAVKERNIRLCYIRLPEISGVSPVESNLAFVSTIRRGMEDAGYQTGTARPFDTSPRPLGLLALIALSVSAGTVLLLSSLASLSSLIRYGLLAIGFIGALGLVMMGETGRQLLAFIAALVFPTLGFTLLIGPHLKRNTAEKLPALKAGALLLGMSVFTLLGAALIVGLLADRAYMVKFNQFMGVKAAHLLPMLGVVFVMAAGLPVFGKPFAEVRRDVTDNLRRVVGHPLFVWHALAVVAAFVIIGFAVLRTGNDPGVGVSGIELKFRSILDQIMAVRPRTKEFLIGHPALFLGIGLLLTRRRAWALPLIALGIIGQVSILNTFCHIHTPLQVTILRVFNGLVLGILLGAGAWYLFGRPKENARPMDKL